MTTALRLTLGAATLALAFSCVVGCEGGRIDPATHANTGGSSDHGEALILGAGCGACHVIPGVRGARGVVGPPLTSFARRTFIAGVLPNAPANLVRWLVDPRLTNPKTAMPNLNLTEHDARDIAAYLYTLD
jgi:cytochrome c